MGFFVFGENVGNLCCPSVGVRALAKRSMGNVARYARVWLARCRGFGCSQNAPLCVSEMSVAYAPIGCRGKLGRSENSEGRKARNFGRPRDGRCSCRGYGARILTALPCPPPATARVGTRIATVTLLAGRYTLGHPKGELLVTALRPPRSGGLMSVRHEADRYPDIALAPWRGKGSA